MLQRNGPKSDNPYEQFIIDFMRKYGLQIGRGAAQVGVEFLLLSRLIWSANLNDKCILQDSTTRQVSIRERP